MNQKDHQAIQSWLSPDGGNARLLDLSYSNDAGSPQWPGDVKSFESRAELNLQRDGCFTRSFWMLEHYGTHLDAPAHFILGGWTVEQIPVERLFGPAVVFDVRAAAETDSDCQLPIAVIAAWEQANGQIPRGAIALLRTGWASRWPDSVRYLNRDSDGVMHFPGFGIESVRLLIERGVVGIGADTMSVDRGASRDFPVHQLALSAGLYHLENVSDFAALPEAGASLIVAPLKLSGGSGGPCRIFAILPH